MRVCDCVRALTIPTQVQCAFVCVLKVSDDDGVHPFVFVVGLDHLQINRAHSVIYTSLIHPSTTTPFVEGIYRGLFYIPRNLSHTEI